MMDYASKIRVIEGFPRKGISFKDITTLLKDGPAFRAIIGDLADSLKGVKLDAIAAPEARGFIIGAPLSCALGVGFLPIRKKGKLPYTTRATIYGLEYGEDALEIHVDAVSSGMSVAVVDDLLATSGTALACIKLVEGLGGAVTAVRFAVELPELHGREKLAGYDVKSIVRLD